MAMDRCLPSPGAEGDAAKYQKVWFIALDRIEQVFAKLKQPRNPEVRSPFASKKAGGRREGSG